MAATSKQLTMLFLPKDLQLKKTGTKCEFYFSLFDI